MKQTGGRRGEKTRGEMRWDGWEGWRKGGGREREEGNGDRGVQISPEQNDEK